MVFVHPDDLRHQGLVDAQLVDLVSEADDGTERRAPDFRVTGHEQPLGCAAASYPETNPLIPLDSVAQQSNTPTSKSVVIHLMPHGS